MDVRWQLQVSRHLGRQDRCAREETPCRGRYATGSADLSQIKVFRLWLGPVGPADVPPSVFTQLYFLGWQTFKLWETLQKHKSWKYSFIIKQFLRHQITIAISAVSRDQIEMKKP